MLLLLLAALSLTTQERTPPQFPADVRLIRLDVSVVDGAGRAVAGLLAEDFKVTEDGRPVGISYFEAVEAVEALEPTARGAQAAHETPGRRLLLLVDTAAMTTGQLIRARESTARYVREGTTDGDWVRVVNLATGRAWDGWIPEDRLRLEMAVRAIERGASLWASAGRMTEGIETRFESDVAGASQAETSGQFLSVFAQTAGLLGTLESLIVQLTGVEGRKALVLVSPGFPQLRDLDRRLETVATLARQAATAVYFVDAAGLDGLTPQPGQALVPAFEAAWGRSGGAQDLAEATGGFTSRFANSLLPALKRIGGELRTYYVVGYVPTRPDDGRFRSVKVRVDVDGVKVRTKKGYLAGR